MDSQRNSGFSETVNKGGALTAFPLLLLSNAVRGSIQRRSYNTFERSLKLFFEAVVQHMIPVEAIVRNCYFDVAALITKRYYLTNGAICDIIGTFSVSLINTWKCSYWLIRTGESVNPPKKGEIFPFLMKIYLFFKAKIACADGKFELRWPCRTTSNETPSHIEAAQDGQCDL